MPHRPAPPTLSQSPGGAGGWGPAAGLTLVLLAYSNGSAWWAMRRGDDPAVIYRWGTPLLTAMLLLGTLLFGRVRPGRLLRAVGLQGAGSGRALVGGLAAGAALAGPPLLFFARPMVLDTPLEYGAITDLSPAAFRRHIFRDLALGVALNEELLFRGLLQAAWTRAAGPRGALVLSSLAFGGWHLTVTLDTLRNTNIAAAATPLPAVLRPHAHTLGVIGGVLATAIAGGIFSGLRTWARGNLLAPILAHWLVDALMVVALYRRSHPPTPRLSPPTGR